MILYIFLEIILLILIFVIIKILFTKEKSKFFSNVINVLLILWIVLLVLECFARNQNGLTWELNNSTLIGIYTYTQLVAVVLFVIYWFVMHVKRKWIDFDSLFCIIKKYIGNIAFIAVMLSIKCNICIYIRLIICLLLNWIIMLDFLIYKDTNFIL